MKDEAANRSAARRMLKKLREENQKKLREVRVQLGESLLRSKGVALPASDIDRERMAQIEACKDLIQSKSRELDEWTQHRDRAAHKGMTKQAQFRQQMIT